MVTSRGISFLDHLICIFRASSVEILIDLDAYQTSLASDLIESLAKLLALTDRLSVV